MGIQQQQKGAVLEPGCGSVPWFATVSRPAIALVRTGPPMGRAGLGIVEEAQGHTAFCWERR